MGPSRLPRKPRGGRSRQLQHHGEAGQSATKPERSGHRAPSIRGRPSFCRVTGWPSAVLWSGPKSTGSTSPQPVSLRKAFSPSPFLPPYASPPADLNQSLTGSHTGTTTDCTQTRPSCLSGGATCQVHDPSTSPGRASTEGVSRPELNGAQTPLESVGDGPLFKIICSSAGSKLWTTF